MKARYFIWCIVALAVLGRTNVPAETRYYAVFVEGKKVGHSIQSRVVTGRKVTTTERVSITVSRANVPVTVNMSETSIETTKGEPLGFESVQDLGLMAIKVVGKVTGGTKVDVTFSSMGGGRKQELEWPGGAVMAEGLRLLAMKKGLVEGTQYTARIFSPSLLQALPAVVRIGPKEQVDLLGRVVQLTKVTTEFEMPGAGRMVTVSYVDDELQPQKMIMPLAGMTVEMVACARQVAFSDNDVLELIDRMFVPSPKPLQNLASADSITYYIRPVAGANSLNIPSTDNQTVRHGRQGTIIVTVRPVAPPAGAKIPYRGKDEKILEALKPSRFLQSDRKEIISLARRAVGRTTDAAEAAEKIESFVAGYIVNKGLSVGYASAAEVAASRQGDCSEFAVLTAAMCRAVGIPARVVVGVAYVKEFAGRRDLFGGHAWVEVYIGGKWVGLDAAFRNSGRGGYDAGHIALAVGNGDPEDFFGLINNLGRFRIERVIVRERKK